MVSKTRCLAARAEDEREKTAQRMERLVTVVLSNVTTTLVTKDGEGWDGAFRQHGSHSTCLGADEVDDELKIGGLQLQVFSTRLDER